jgi:hypothetical protein
MFSANSYLEIFAPYINPSSDVSLQQRKIGIVSRQSNPVVIEVPLSFSLLERGRSISQ